MSLHGSASWPSSDNLEAVGLFDGGETSIRLGYDPRNGKPLWFSGDQHILTVAPPGSGKTTAAVIPTLCTYPGSAVVTDPKGALTAQTAALREKQFGHRIVVLNPWRDMITESLGVDLGDTGFDPLASLKADDPEIYENAEMIAGLLCPTPPNVADPYWTKTGRRIITACLIYLVMSPDHECTLPALYALVRTSRIGWADLAKSMLMTGIPALELYADDLVSPLESEKQWAGVHGAVLDATEVYAPFKALGRHVRQNGFDPSCLKRENVTVYIVVPSNRREENKAWLALVMALCAEAVGKPGPSKPVLLLAEEFANLGFMPSISRAMAEYREAGLRCWLIVQSLHQLHRIYGQEGAQEIIDLCGIKQFFRVDDLKLARDLEAIIGTYTAQTMSSSAGWSDRERPKTTGAIQNRNLNESQSYSEMAVPLLRAQDILNLPPNLQIITAAGLTRPILAELRPYFFDAELRETVAPNPYRPELPPVPETPRPSSPGLTWLHLVLSIIPAGGVGIVALAVAKVLGMEHDRAVSLSHAAGWFSLIVFVGLLWLEDRRNAKKA